MQFKQWIRERLYMDGVANVKRDGPMWSVYSELARDLISIVLR